MHNQQHSMNDTDNLYDKFEVVRSRRALSPALNGLPQREQRPFQNINSELFPRSPPKIKNNSCNFSSMLGTSQQKSGTKENS